MCVNRSLSDCGCRAPCKEQIYNVQSTTAKYPQANSWVLEALKYNITYNGSTIDQMFDEIKVSESDLRRAFQEKTMASLAKLKGKGRCGFDLIQNSFELYRL